MENHTWETSFEDGGNKMVHTFSDRIQVVFYRDMELLGILKDRELIDSFHPDRNFSIEDYINYLMKIEKEAKRLDQIKPNDHENCAE